jgi:integrase
LAQTPYIPKLKENNVRKGFFEYPDFMAARDALPDYLKGFVTFAYRTGWRKSEVEKLTWSQVDRVQGIVHLEPGETKNDEGRTVYLDDELRGVIGWQWEARKKNEKLLPYVFLNEDGTDKIKEFRKTWHRACESIGKPNLLFHDLRRSAVRNMVRSGIPERVAMMVSGHKTRAVFERYNIVSNADLKAAAQRQADYLESQKGYKTVTITKIDKKREVNHDS